MKPHLRACVCAWVGALWPQGAGAQDGGLTFEAALQRAREHGAAVVTGRFRIEEARARLRGAGLLRDNPVLESAVGDRAGSEAADLELALSQTFELGGRRRSRVQAAEAGLAREAASVADGRMRALRDVALAFQRGLFAAERVRLASASEGHAAAVERIATRRHESGDVAALDVNLAAGALARARSELRAAEAAQALAYGELRALIALEPDAPLTLSGDLRPRPVAELLALLEPLATRPDVLALEAEVREAEAETALGRGLRWPDVTPSVRYERDDGTNVLWGGLTFSLPAWNRGQELRGRGEARASRLRASAAALRRVARQELASARAAYRLRVAAIEELDLAAARLEENETLARRSYEEGQIGLGELLLVRRETAEARLVHLGRRLEAAELEIELLVRAGVLR